jgi:GNAT superfamily N-acetyltransferase
MRVEQFEVPDPANIRAWHEMNRAAQAVDAPLAPPPSLRVLTGWLTGRTDYMAHEGWFVPGERGGRWDGAYLLGLPVKDNTHRARLSLLVPVERRRRGLGTALARHAIEQAGRHGRMLLTAGAMEGSAGPAFAARMGARHDLTDVRRVQDLDTIPAARLAELRQRAEHAARGYSLVSWTGSTPEEHIGQVAIVTTDLADAPHAPGHKPEPVDEDRVRQDDRLAIAQGMRLYTVAARCDETGDLAGITQIAVDPERAAWGFQEFTVVARPHRGHRLGLLVKVAMLEWLTGAEPGVRRILTGNAAANKHMIAINEELGYRVLDRYQIWQVDVPAPAGAPVPTASVASTP